MTTTENLIIGCFIVAVIEKDKLKEIFNLTYKKLTELAVNDSLNYGLKT